MVTNRSRIKLLGLALMLLPTSFSLADTSHKLNSVIDNVTLSGYVDTSAVWSPGDGSGPIPGRTTSGSDKNDGFNLHFAGVALEAETPGSNGINARFRTEFLFGPDANALGATSSGDADSDFAVREAYVELGIPLQNELSVKLGAFNTLIGYETFVPLENAHWSRPYAFYIEPFTHTGALLSYPINDVIEVSAAVVNSWNAVLNQRPTDVGGDITETQKTYLASVAISAPSDVPLFGDGSLVFAFADGFSGSESVRDVNSYYVGGSVPAFNEKVIFGIAYDYNEFTPLVGEEMDAYTIALYASLQATEKLSFHTRSEYANGDPGTWGTLNTVEDDEFYALTFTTQYDLVENLLTRVEFRWDTDLSDGPGAFNNPPSSGSSVEDNNYQVALEMGFQF